MAKFCVRFDWVHEEVKQPFVERTCSFVENPRGAENYEQNSAGSEVKNPREVFGERRILFIDVRLGVLIEGLNVHKGSAKNDIKLDQSMLPPDEIPRINQQSSGK